MSNPNRGGVQTDLDSRKTLWLWLLAAVMAFALLFGVVKWVAGGHG